MGVLWLSSYPKSGNTWARFLLYTAQHGFPAWSRQLRRRIPDLYIDAYDPAAEPGPIVKTHDPCTDAHRDIDRSRGAIVITRHPGRVARSLYRYIRLTQRGAVPAPLDYARRFAEHGGDPDWHASTIEEHFRSWTEQDRFPALHLRYEDMQADTRAALARMTEHAGLGVDDAGIDRAVRACTRERMRRFEWKQKLLRRPKGDAVLSGSLADMIRGRSFVTMPDSGDPFGDDAPRIDALFEDRFAAVLDAMGYATGPRGADRRAHEKTGARPGL